MTDKNIVRLLRLNLQTGFKILLKEYKEPIYWHIRRLTVNHEDAQDATQETFIRVYRSFGSYDSSRPLKTWLYRIATNEALRIIGRRHPAIDLDNCGEAMETLADRYLDLSDVEGVNLQKAINSLPLKQRLTFNLRYYDELGFDEIARITDSTPDSAKANWHNAKTKVYDYLKQIYG